jgi:hypothetical protein
MIEQHDAASGGDEDEASQLYSLANSILKECMEAASFANLETAIHLFREALNLRPSPDLLQSDLLKDLATALVARFILTNQCQSLDEACELHCQAFSQWVDGLQEASGIGQSVDEVRVLPESGG